MTRSEEPVFILGVGAQKAGTSWLYRQLNKNPAVNMGFAKEYHTWDFIYRRDPKWRSATVEKGETAYDALLRMMRCSDGGYETYFKGLINETVRYTGDITPAYSGLSETHFALIKERMERAGFSVKVIFLMRDPAERNWSAMRMLHRNGRKFENITSETDLLNGFGDFYKMPYMVGRTRYDRTVEALRKAFEEKNTFFSIYENMFNDDFTSLLSEFLGLKLNEVDFHEKVNAYESMNLPSNDYYACKEYYAEVYEYCKKHFPVTAESWGRNGDCRL